MMKRIFSILIIIFLICGIILPFCGCSQKRVGLDEGISQRVISEDDPVYFDDEAIALAETSKDTASLRGEALRAYNLVNEVRENTGLQPLVWDSNLESTSDVRAKEIEAKFSHTRPNGSAWYTVDSRIMGGENLAFGYNSAADVVSGWMNSPTHKENVLYPDFNKISISVYRGDDSTWYWAQEFGY